MRQKGVEGSVATQGRQEEERQTGHETSAARTRKDGSQQGEREHYWTPVDRSQQGISALGPAFTGGSGERQPVHRAERGKVGQGRGVGAQ